MARLRHSKSKASALSGCRALSVLMWRAPRRLRPAVKSIIRCAGAQQESACQHDERCNSTHVRSSIDKPRTGDGETIARLIRQEHDAGITYPSGVRRRTHPMPPCGAGRASRRAVRAPSPSVTCISRWRREPQRVECLRVRWRAASGTKLCVPEAARAFAASMSTFQLLRPVGMA